MSLFKTRFFDRGRNKSRFISPTGVGPCVRLRSATLQDIPISQLLFALWVQPGAPRPEVL